MIVLTYLLAGSLAFQQAPPAPVSALLSAVASGDLPAARATLSSEVVIMDARGRNQIASSLKVFVAHVRGCERSALTWDVDGQDARRAAASVTWTCPARQTVQAFIWTDATGVVNITFGMPLQQ